MLQLRAVQRYAPGVALSAALAMGGMALGSVGWLQQHGFSALTLAIVLGMLLGNTAYPRFAAASGPGVDFARQRLLRMGIVLYGLRLTMQDIGQVGWTGVAVDAAVLASTFALATLLGTRWFGVDRKTAMLIGAGSSVCGAAAVMATEPVVKARAEQVAVAVATVVVFGTLAIFLYPLLFELNTRFAFVPGGAARFGIYIGSTVHEVAQVVAAANSVGGTAAGTAVIAKMVRVMMLAPFLVMLSTWLRGHATGEREKVTVPWFAFGFVAVVLVNSVHPLSARASEWATRLDTVLLAMAMAALGLATQLTAIRRAGVRPLLLAAVLFAWLVVGGALMNRWVPALIG